MKKIVFFLIILAVFATGCKKKKSKDLNYNDSNPIVMVLSGPEHNTHVPPHTYDHLIQVTSDYDITYSAINPGDLTVISVSSDGYIHGKNVGAAMVKMDNGYESLDVAVIVKLFKEPILSFGCSESKIRDRYGRPQASGNLPGDTIRYLRYLPSTGFSWTCPEMDFFLYQEAYYHVNVYLRNEVETLIDDYLNENFNYFTTVGDTLSLYKRKSDTTLICGIFASHNEWNEWVLSYYRIEPANSLESVLKSVPRSSKLRY